MKAIRNQTLGQLVIINPINMLVFERYGLDFCCKGNHTLQDACLEKGILVETILNQLEKSPDKNIIRTTPVNFSRKDPEVLIDYITKKHHAYVNRMLPLIEENLYKTVERHASENPELAIVLNLFLEVKAEMEQHLLKEECILFPYIIRLEKANRNPFSDAVPLAHFVGKPIRMMESEHESTGKRMAEIREITNQYTPNSGACFTHTLVFQQLHDFELDLHQHVHLENNILFPKAVELENDLLVCRESTPQFNNIS